MEPVDTIWMDGKFVPWGDANVPVMTHALHYGTAVFEGIRCYSTDHGPRVFRLPEHVDRLFFSAKAIDLEIPYTKEEITQAMLELIRKNNLTACYIRPLVYYGFKRLGPPPMGVPTRVALVAVKYDPYLGDKSVRVIVSKYRRINPDATVIHAKISGHYFNSALAELEAHHAGADEAILLDDHGFIAEGGAVNFFMLKGNTLSTPTDRAILPGITRDSLMSLAKNELGWSVEERDIHPDELRECDEAFFCGTASEVAPIAQVGDLQIKQPDAPKAHALKSLYKRVVTGQEPKYMGWLTPT